MRFLKKLILLTVLFGLCTFRLLAQNDTLNHTVVYDPSNLSICFSNGKIYANFKNFMFFNQTKNIYLPYEHIFLSVPYNSKSFHLVYRVDSIVNIPLESLKHGIDNITNISNYKKVAADSSYLRSSNPISQCKIITSGYLLGDNQIVKLWISPITYNSPLQILTLTTNARIELSYDIDEEIIPPIARYDLDTKEVDLARIAPFVANSNSLLSNSYVCNNVIPAVQPQQSIPTYKYCIITNRYLEPSFKKILAMKRQKGISAGTICVEDLMASPYFANGDNQGTSFPTLTDTAAVVRKYLKYAFQSSIAPTQYVLMGGKAPYSPVRYCHTTISSSNNNHNHVSSDMYFGNLTMPWLHESSTFDVINESEYIISNSIKHHLTFPYYPDIFVGRLLCSSQDDVYNYSDKLHRYVFNPGNGDFTYLTKALFTTMMSGDTTLNEVTSNNCNVFNHVDHINSYLMQYNGAQMLDYFNNNISGFIGVHAHGEPQSIEVLKQNNSRRYLITSLDRNQGKDITIDETNNGLDCLTNKNYPFIFYSTSCTTIPYDKAQSFCGSTQFEDCYNFGSSFTLGKDYGGPAFLGSTRNNYVGSAIYLETDFIRSVFNRDMAQIGVADAFSKVFIYNSKPKPFDHTLLAHNLLGDPEFEMWTSEPQRYDGLSISRYSVSSYVQGITQSDTISYCDNDGNVGRIYGEDGLAVLVGVSHNSSIMVYNHNHIPYIFPLLLQNCDINNSQYVYASAFSAGSDVSTSVDSGNVTIKNGAIYEVEATDDVHLGEGFIVENGATFAIKTPGKVTIDGCVFQSGAKVKIEAGNIEIAKNCTAERGSKVEFTKYID